MDKFIIMPKNNEQIRIITKKQINTFDFILAVLLNEKIIELYLTTYSIGKKTILQLKDLLDSGKILKLTLLINDGFKKFKPTEWNLLKTLNSQIKAEHNHSKIALIKTDKNYYVIEGSGNYSTNGSIEQYCFDNNKNIFDFHKNWINLL